MLEPYWKKDRDLTPETVSALLEDQFPELSPISAKYLDEGWNCEVFRVNQKLVFRFPKRKEAEESFEKERVLLPEISRQLGVQVPILKWQGQASRHFRYRFFGCEMLEGVTALEMESKTVDASQLGKFLDSLHKIELKPEHQQLLTRYEGQEALGDKAKNYLKELPKHQARLPKQLYQNLLGFLKSFKEIPEPKAPERLIHADWYREHMIYQGNNLTGVIDWGAMEMRNPANDFAGIFHWLGEKGVRSALRSYNGPVDEKALPWIRQRAFFRALEDLVYGIEAEKPEYLKSGLNGIENFFS